MKKFISLYVLSSFCFMPVLQAQEDPVVISVAPNSPEESCILELKTIAENKWGIQFDSLTKKNGGKVSQPFSVNSYNDFLEYSKLPVPTDSDSSIKYYPNNLDNSSIKEKTDSDKVYKANKPHIAPILHTDGTSTFVGDFEGAPQYIDGYYVDTRVLTFGSRMPNFFFPVKSRQEASDDGDANQFANGLGYDDFRNYVLYTHHISKNKESDQAKRFLSCGIVRTIPKSGHPKSLAIDDYYGNTFVGSSYAVDEEKPIERDGYSFVKADVVIQAVKDPLFTPHFQFKVLSLAYDNSSDFLNETVTFPLQEQAMTNPDSQTDMRQTIVNFLDLNAKDNHAQGVEAGTIGGDTVAGIDFSSLQASTFKEAPIISPTGGMALEGGVKYDVYKEVQAIANPTLRAYMETALVPGYEEVFDALDPETMPPLFKAIQACPLTFEEKVANVEYALEHSSGGANITPENIQYKHLNFGECVVPFEDERVQFIQKNNVYSDAFARVANETLHVDIADPSKLSLADLQAMEEKAVIFEKEKQVKKDAYESASSTYNSCGRALLEEKVALNRGDIDETIFKANTTTIADKCNDALTVDTVNLALEDQIVFSFENDIEEQLLQEVLVKKDLTVIESIIEDSQEEPVIKTEVESNEWWKQQYIFFVISGVLALLGFIALLFGMMNKK